jgi:hypothetical protein
MLSKSQQVMFDKIKMKKLTSKQKGDFYYRMSKILSKKLDELEAISYLLDTIPLSYQDKIDLRVPAMRAMDITEKLVKRLDPAYPSPIIKDSRGIERDIRETPLAGEKWNMVGRRAVRHFTVNMKSYLPGVADADATIKTSYEPIAEEVAFLNRLTEHQLNLEKIREESARNHKRFSAKEFTVEILPRLKKQGNNFEAKVMCIVGDHIHDTTQEESAEQFDKTEELALGRSERNELKNTPAIGPK